MKKSYQFIALCWITLSAAATISSCGGNNRPDPKEKAEEQNEAKFQESSAADNAQYVVDAYVGGWCEVEKSKIAESKAMNKSVRDFASEMVSAHTNVNGKLKTLAESEHISLPADLPEDKKEDIEECRNEKAGSDFDKHYIKKQVEKHEKMVEMVEKASKEATDTEVKEFFTSILPELRHHLEMAMDIRDRLK